VEEQNSEDLTAVADQTLAFNTNSELRNAIIQYALQYVGYPYVHGGQSLATGTDCSGFTSYVYREFGYSLSRTPSGQYKGNGRSVSLAEAQPGDIICYGSGSCTHVALYIGNGQIVHEANKSKGCIISGINFMNILGVKNVID
jgi:cell wall-associated NlpC family hydrolase